MKPKLSTVDGCLPETGEIIEVSDDNKSWREAIFVKEIADDANLYCIDHPYACVFAKSHITVNHYLMYWKMIRSKTKQN